MLADKTLQTDLFLSEALAELEEQPSEEVLDMLAGTFLVPKEYAFVRSRGCLACGSTELDRLMQGALSGLGHPDRSAWPYASVAGDEILFSCRACGKVSQFIFWFRKQLAGFIHRSH